MRTHNTYLDYKVYSMDALNCYISAYEYIVDTDVKPKYYIINILDIFNKYSNYGDDLFIIVEIILSHVQEILHSKDFIFNINDILKNNNIDIDHELINIKNDLFDILVSYIDIYDNDTLYFGINKNKNVLIAVI